MTKQHARKCAFANHPHAQSGHGVQGMQCRCIKPACDCDGYHTFTELYDHRIVLWIALCKMRANVMDTSDHAYFEDVWRSKNHSDGEPAFGGTWFVLGIGKDQGSQITYHLPIEKWDICDFAETLEKAPEFDGHTSDDVLERIDAL